MKSPFCLLAGTKTDRSQESWTRPSRGRTFVARTQLSDETGIPQGVVVSFDGWEDSGCVSDIIYIEEIYT